MKIYLVEYGDKYEGPYDTWAFLNLDNAKKFISDLQILHVYDNRVFKFGPWKLKKNEKWSKENCATTETDLLEIWTIDSNERIWLKFLTVKDKDAL